jgi:hypothetical protein
LLAAQRGGSPARASAKPGLVRLHIVVPKHRGRSPRYISPATGFIVVDVFNASHVKVATTSQNLTPGSPGCTPAGGQPVTCTIQIALAPASYSANVVTYDRNGGNALSRHLGFPFVISRGVANDISMILEGVPASVHVVAEPDAVFLGGNQTTGFQFAGLAAQTVDVYARDADGNVILGAGAASVSLSSGAPALTVTPVGKSNPNQFVLTRTAHPGTGTMLTAKATPAGGGPPTTVTPSLQFVPLIYMYQTGGIGEYVPWSNAPVLTITSGLSGQMAPGVTFQDNQFLALDSAGNLYALDTPGNHVVVYAPGSSIPLRTISDGIQTPNAMGFDANGVLYVANDSNVTLYDPGSASVKLTVSASIAFPVALAFDGQGHFFVDNFGATNPMGSGDVTEYALQFGTTPVRTIDDGVAFPYGIGVDSNGLLYVGSAGEDAGNNTVTVYSTSGTTPSTTLTLGPSDILSSPFIGGLAVDPAGDMCVALLTEVTCGTVASPFVDQIFGFSQTDDYSPAMGFDSTGALYVLNLQPDDTMERTFAPFAGGLTLHPSPTSVISGSTTVFAVTVQR